MKTIIKVFRAKTWEELEQDMNRFMQASDMQGWPMITHSVDMAGHTVIMPCVVSDQQIESLDALGLLPSGVTKGK